MSLLRSGHQEGIGVELKTLRAFNLISSIQSGSLLAIEICLIIFSLNHGFRFS